MGLWVSELDALGAGAFIVVVVSLSCMSPSVTVTTGTSHCQGILGQSAGSEHPLVIDDDQDFVALGLPGSGTEDDPYVIRGLGGWISISNTRSYFVITDYAKPQFTDLSEPAIGFENVSHGSIINSTIRGYAGGVFIMESSNCSVSDSVLEHCDEGIRLYSSVSCLVTRCRLYDIRHGGISAYCNSSKLLSNTVVYNGNGVAVGGNDNVMYGNRIGWNRQLNAWSMGDNNAWDDGLSIGNSWSDYNGTDTYAIEGGAVDNYPQKLEGDYLGPSIAWIEYASGTVDSLVPLDGLLFEVNASDPSGVDTVLIWLRGYRNDFYFNWTSEKMTQVGPSEYVLLIDGPFSSVWVWFYAWVNDTCGNPSQLDGSSLKFDYWNRTEPTSGPDLVPVVLARGIAGAVLIVAIVLAIVLRRGWPGLRSNPSESVA